MAAYIRNRVRLLTCVYSDTNLNLNPNRQPPNGNDTSPISKYRRATDSNAAELSLTEWTLWYVMVNVCTYCTVLDILVSRSLFSKLRSIKLMENETNVSQLSL